MAIDSAECAACGGRASLTEYNARHGWACPHCGQSHWPAGDGWAASNAGPRTAAATSGIHPTRAAAAGYSTSVDLVTGRRALSPATRIASRILAVGAVAAAALIARAMLG